MIHINSKISFLLLCLFALRLALCMPASEQTIELASDHVSVVEAIYASSTFTESCELLEHTIRQALINAPEDLAVYHLRKKLELKVDAASLEKKRFEARNCTIRELLRQFADTWNVDAIIKANTITISPRKLKHQTRGRQQGAAK